MKIIFITLCSFLALCSSATVPTPFYVQEQAYSLTEHADNQNLTFLQSDSTIMEKENTINGLFMMGKKALGGQPDYLLDSKYAPFKGHWSGFYYGFVNFTNTDYSMYPPEKGEFMELDWTHSFVMQFNILRYSINFVQKNNFGLVTGLGLEYQRLRFEHNYTTIALEEHKVQPVNLSQDPDLATIKRSSFKTFYLTIPVMLELQLPAHMKEGFYVSAGFMGGIRMHSKTKIVYDNLNGKKHKRKDKGNFNMVPFKADAVARIGFRNINLWGSYTLTEMFKSGKGPKLHPYSLGIGVTF